MDLGPHSSDYLPRPPLVGGPTRFIGDVHGKINRYIDVAMGAERSVQVGDMGIGFLPPRDEQPIRDLHGNPARAFIRGNHDDPHRCPSVPGWIEDGAWDPESSMMFIGGAWSIDRAWRTPGLDWWPEEQVSEKKFRVLHDLYTSARPRIMVTHDCPMAVANRLFIEGTNERQYWTVTGSCLDAMFEDHQPAVWVFGHWHESRDEVIEGCRFICLDELEHIDLDLEDFL